MAMKTDLTTTYVAAKMTRQQVLDSIKRDYDETYFFTGVVLSMVPVAKELLGPLYALVCSENIGLHVWKQLL